MTIHEERKIKCPKCGTKVKTSVWSSLNVLIDPEVKKDLLEGKINQFQCINCDFTAPLLVPSFLYHDVKNEFCVQCFPFESLEDDNFFDLFSSKGKLNLDMKHMPNYMKDIHVVFSMEELVRYVMFRDKLSEMRK